LLKYFLQKAKKSCFVNSLTSNHAGCGKMADYEREVFMEYDEDKIDEVVLALLFLTSSRDNFGTRAWKGQDWEAMNRLHEKGYISNPKTKALSVTLTDEGAKLSQELFVKYFGKKE
jgi:hypothetical protein